MSWIVLLGAGGLRRGRVPYIAKRQKFKNGWIVVEILAPGALPYALRLEPCALKTQGSKHKVALYLEP